MPLPPDIDYDQLPEREETDPAEVGTEIYDSATVRALSAVIEYIDRANPSVSDIRTMCQAAISRLREAT